VVLTNQAAALIANNNVYNIVYQKKRLDVDGSDVGVVIF
jgi:hypothetical protein